MLQVAHMSALYSTADDLHPGLLEFGSPFDDLLSSCTGGHALTPGSSTGTGSAHQHQHHHAAATVLPAGARCRTPRCNATVVGVCEGERSYMHSDQDVTAEYAFMHLAVLVDVIILRPETRCKFI